MAQNLSPQDRIQPLSVGNVVTAGVRLYRSHLKLYFNIALVATLWELLPFVALIPLPLLFIYGKFKFSNLWLLVLVWLLLSIYCAAKYLVNAALLSRLAFNELVDQPESARAARNHINPRMWLFLLTGILVFLIFVGIEIVLFMFGGFVFGLLTAVGISAKGNLTLIAIMALTGTVLGIALLIAIFWFAMRFFIAEIPLAIEDDIGAVKTISRSWDLTKGHVGRICLIATVAFLVTIPVAIIAQIATNIIQEILLKALPTDSTSIAFVALSSLLGFIVGLLSNILILPFWQAVKAVIYYDLRSRREGLGLQLRDRPV